MPKTRLLNKNRNKNNKKRNHMTKKKGGGNLVEPGVFDSLKIDDGTSNIERSEMPQLDCCIL
jgi:hypothetical protein